MDEGFSTRNLRQIWDTQTRRGAELAHLYPEVSASLREVRELRAERAARRRAALAAGPSSDELYAAMVESESEVISARARMDGTLTAALHSTGSEIQHQIAQATFSWPLSAGPLRRGKQTYTIARSPSAYFTAKQLETNLRALSRVPAMSRDALVGQVVQSLSDPLPKSIARVDIDSFFESIQHERILTLLRQRGLGKASMYLVETLLAAYSEVGTAGIGLPRGVGVSSRLAELYLQEIDWEIRRLPGVILAARYVDDIVVVSGRSSAANGSDDHEAKIRAALTRFGLAANEDKTYTIPAITGGNFSVWEFLGYRFHKSGHLELKLVQPRVDELARRLRASFEVWDKRDPHDASYQGLLTNRIKLLTGNTRLSNNKRNALVGSYFSHRHLSELSQFDYLDRVLRDLVGARTLPTGLAERLRRLSFVRGFRERTVHRLTPRQIGDATRLWRNA